MLGAAVRGVLASASAPREPPDSIDETSEDLDVRGLPNCKLCDRLALEGTLCLRCNRAKVLRTKAGGRRRQSRVEGQYSDSSSDTLEIERANSDEAAFYTVSCVPSGEKGVLISGLIHTMQDTVDLRFNLTWSLGTYLTDVPQRIGRNDALDVAVECLVDTHATYCLHRPPSRHGLMKYTEGLQILRRYLDVPARARSSETLCAVQVLMICQMFIGIRSSGATGHGEGAAQMLKARGYYEPRDDFDSKLVQCLRGPVLFEALFNKRIRFSRWEWKRLIENRLDGDLPEGKMVQILSHVPEFQRRGRRLLKWPVKDPELVPELLTQWRETKLLMKEVEDRVHRVEEKIAESPKVSFALDQVLAIVRRGHALGLFVAIMLGCLIAAVDPEDTEKRLELDSYAHNILAIAKSLIPWRPLGANIMPLALSVAWVAASTPSLRTSIEESYVEYLAYFHPGQDIATTRKQLHDLERGMFLRS